MASYHNSLLKFFERLRARAYPRGFLIYMFNKAPPFSARSSLLTSTGGKDKAAPFVLKLTYSQLARNVATPGILVDKDGDLPSHLNTLPRVVCWKRAPQLGALLKNRGHRGPTNKMRSQLPAPWLGDGELAPGDFT